MMDREQLILELQVIANGRYISVGYQLQVMAEALLELLRAQSPAAKDDGTENK